VQIIISLLFKNYYCFFAAIRDQPFALNLSAMLIVQGEPYVNVFCKQCASASIVEPSSSPTSDTKELYRPLALLEPGAKIFIFCVYQLWYTVGTVVRITLKLTVMQGRARGANGATDPAFKAEGIKRVHYKSYIL